MMLQQVSVNDITTLQLTLNLLLQPQGQQVMQRRGSYSFPSTEIESQKRNLQHFSSTFQNDIFNTKKQLDGRIQRGSFVTFEIFRRKLYKMLLESCLVERRVRKNLKYFRHTAGDHFKDMSRFF